MNVVLDSENLRKLQLVQLELLVELDRICRNNNIIYQLYSGTLLGAVRHKGFIPWDDDLDVCLLRKDYEKLLKLLKDELNEKYFLQTHDTDKNYVHAFARLRKNNTILLQESFKEMDMHHGIFIDIFPLDNILLNTFKGKIQYHLVYFIRRVKNFKNIGYVKNSKKKLRTLIKLLVYYMLKGISIKKLNIFETRIMSMFMDEETTYSTHLSDAGKECYHLYKISNEKFYDVIDLEFEGQLFLAPRDYHDVLTKIFGDYMIPPVAENQKPHHGIIKVCFDTFSNVDNLSNKNEKNKIVEKNK